MRRDPRRPVAGVMGSGTEAHRELAEPLGRFLARRGLHLLTGGGQGTMRAVAEAFVAEPLRAGLSIGILPGWIDARGRPHRPAGYPNDAVELAIATHLPLTGAQGTLPGSRNHLNVLSASVVIVLPGGEGTRSEAVLARRYGTAVVLHGPPERFDAFDASLPRAPTLEEVALFVDAVLEAP